MLNNDESHDVLIKKRKTLLVAEMRFSILFIALFLIFVETICHGRRTKGKPRKKISGGKMQKRIWKEMKADNIREYLRFLTEYPHGPGSERNRELAEYIAEQWRNSGFDKTEIYPYNILLPYPKQPGEVWLHTDTNVDRKLVIENEPSMDNSDSKGTPIYPFHAYSPKGTVTGEFVYANYGRKSDFKVLRELGVNMTGKIIIARYGKGYRGYKVTQAEKHGAVGIIVYSDPEDHAYPGMEYPNGWMLNKHGVQRGTVNRLSGDALSIGYPSKPNYFRKNVTKYTGNPTIPSQPISYSTAYEILKYMKDESITLPDGFQGGLNFTYALQSGRNRTITLKVYNELETRESLTVCTTLFGSEQPDRYVMLGNHRDAWVYGAGDASSGTAAMMELVRSIGKIVKETGWRPRRSLKACSWGAEESGVQGSTEWADENHQFIMDKVAAYLNTDIAVEGNHTIRLKALKFIGNGIFKVAKAISAPDNSSKTLYEDWLQKSKFIKDDDTMKKPYLNTPSAGSDYKAFWHTYGATIADFRYQFNKKDFPLHSIYAQYHTRYDSFDWMEKFVDPTFKYHLTITKLWVGHLMIIADSVVMPFNLIQYMDQVEYHLNHFEQTYKDLLDKHSISLMFARQRLSALRNKTKTFHRYVSKLNLRKISAFQLRSINDQIMKFERNFLITGMSKRTSARHVIFSTTQYTLRTSKFPGIAEAIYFTVTGTNKDWDEVKRQITLLVWCLDTANRSLDFDEWSHVKNRY